MRNKSNMERLLEVLETQNQKNSLELLSMMQDYTKTLEQSIELMTTEIENLKTQLDSLKNDRLPAKVKEKLKELIAETQAELQVMKTELKDVMKELNEKAGKVLQAFKEKGTVALDNVCQVLDLRGAFEKERQINERNARRCGDKVEKLYKIERECKETGLHFANMAKALMGKEGKSAVDQSPIAFFESMRKPYQINQRSYLKSEVRAKNIVEKFDKLHEKAQSIKKESIQGKLKDFTPKESEKKSDKKEMVI